MRVHHVVLLEEAGQSAHATHLLVHEDENVFPLPLQQGAVELP